MIRPRQGRNIRSCTTFHTQGSDDAAEGLEKSDDWGQEAADVVTPRFVCK